MSVPLENEYYTYQNICVCVLFAVGATELWRNHPLKITHRDVDYNLHKYDSPWYQKCVFKIIYI